MTLVQFVRQGTKPDQLIEEAFKDAQESDGDCKWISEEQCLKVEERDRKSVFIFSKFSGQAFDQIHSTGNRIYGPSVITSCMKNGSQLPKMPHPVHNMSMNGLIISCTSVNKASRAELHEYIQWMCGEVSKDLHNKVSHLIAGEAGSKKYLVAANLKKKIMSPGWVTAVWNENQKELVQADSDHFSSHRCPVFQGFVMTVSGLEASERTEVKEIIEKEGGRFSGEMKINECTHLIVNHPRGQKYEFARKWKIPILSPAWLFDCVEAGYYIEDHKYRIDMKDGDTKAERAPSHDANLSRISLASDISRINETAMNQTAMNQTAMNQTAMNQTAMNQTLVKSAAPDQLDMINLATVKPGMYLDGCKIFLSGVGGTRLEKLRKMINMGGGTRFSQINESVTHVVMGDRVEGHVTLLKEGKFRPHVVSVDWIAASVQNGRQVAEEDFVCLDLPQMAPMSPHPKARLRTSQTAMPPPAPVAPPVGTALTEDPEDMQDLLSQYLPEASDMTNESALIRAAEAAEEADHKEEPPVGEQEEEEDDDATQDPSEEPEQEIFAGKKFAFVGFTADVETQLRELVAEFGGEAVPVTTRAVPDFAVVPLFGCQVNFTATEIVTAAYVQMCVEGEELLEVSSNCLFTPLAMRPGAAPLTECFISLSGYSGTERDCLMQLAEQMGATCQDSFTRKAKEGLQANTHLVVSEAVGSKYQAAKKWKLPAVEKEWLYACLRSGKREPEEQYLVDKPRAEPIKTVASTDIQPEPSTTSASTRPQNMDSQSRVLKTVDLNNCDKNNVQVDSRAKVATSCPIDTSAEGHIGAAAKEMAVAEKDDPTDPALSGVDSPSKFLNPNVAYKPRFDLADFWNALDSPSRTWNQRRKYSEDSIDLDALVTQQLAIAIKNTSSPSKMVSTPERPNAVKLPPWPPHWVVKHVLKQEVIGPLQGVVVYVSEKLCHKQRECNYMAGSLGGDYIWTYDKSCTHFIFQGSVNDTDKQFRLARDEKKIIVAPFWLTMCKEQKARVEESLYPHTYDFYDPDLPLQLSRGPLKGIIINVCKKLGSKQSEYNDMAASLGAEYCWTYDKSCTHFIFQGREKDANREFRSARDDGKIIVSPHWLITCKEKNCRVDESLFPHHYDPNVVLQPPTEPLHGVIINVCKKLSSKQSEYNDMAASLGAEYCWTYDKSCTHFIFQGRQNDTNKEFRLARDDGKIIVSPHWLTMCKEQTARVDESLFPHTYDPNMAISVVKTRNTPDRLARRSTRSQLKKSTPAMKSHPSSVQSNRAAAMATSTAAASGEPTETRPVPKSDPSGSDEGDSGTCDESGSEEVALTQPGQRLAREALVDDIKNLMAATKTSRGKRKPRRTDSMSGDFTDEPEIKRSSTGRQSLKSDEGDLSHGGRTTRSSLRTRGPKKPDISTEPSQAVEVTWEDPSTREQQEMLAAELAKNSESFSPKSHTHSVSEEDGNTMSTDDEINHQRPPSVFLQFPQPEVQTEDEDMPVADAAPVKVADQPAAVSMTDEHAAEVDGDETVDEGAPPPVFLLSGLTPQERDDYGALIEQLGGRMLDSGHYEANCTHLVTGKPSRNEKYLGCVASGKWVLHKSYLEACRQQDAFVQESDHEWGSKATASVLEGQPSHIRKLAAAAHRWRTTLQGQQAGGAFSAWTAVLFTSHKREGGFQRLLEAGGCQIKGQRPPFSLDGVKYAFVEPAHVDIQSELEHLVSAGVLCLKPEYIASFLMEEPAPCTSQYLIKDTLDQGCSETRKRKPSEAQAASDNKRLRRN